MSMEVICLEDAALYALVEQITAHLKEKLNRPTKGFPTRKP
jgi:hypothetical protein